MKLVPIQMKDNWILDQRMDEKINSKLLIIFRTGSFILLVHLFCSPVHFYCSFIKIAICVPKRRGSNKKNIRYFLNVFRINDGQVPASAPETDNLEGTGNELTSFESTWNDGTDQNFRLYFRVNIIIYI